MRKSAFVVLAGLTVVALAIAILVWPRAPADGATKVRRPVVAGAAGRGFYSSDPDELRRQIVGFLDAAKPPKVEGRPIAYIVPHAGYVFSGGVAAHAYKTLEGWSFGTVVIIGPSHHFPVAGAALSSADVWRTPLGDVPVDRRLRDALAEQGGPFSVQDLGHVQEHSVEVQLPFLQVVLKDFRILPAVMTDFSPSNCRAVGERLARALKGKSVLVIASSDLSHYPAYEDAKKVDGAILDAVRKFDPKALFAADKALLAKGVGNLDCTMCGLGPVAAVMTAAKGLGADAVQVLKHANSGDVEPALRGRCVGYGAVAFVRTGVAGAGQAKMPGSHERGTSDDAGATPERGAGAEPQPFTRAQQRKMLETARRSIREYIVSGKRIEVDHDDPALANKSGVFVTLKKRGELRGCIGSILPRQPLIEAVRDMAIAAATEDWRFPRVQPGELDDISIEISVLSYPRKVHSAEEIVVGKHGVIVKQGGRSGVFLPQVAPEQGWTREEMLDRLCLEKAGLARDAWRRGADLYVFTAFVFGEHEKAQASTKR